MFTSHPDLTRVLVDDRRRALILTSDRRHLRHEVRRLRRRRVDT